MKKKIFSLLLTGASLINGCSNNEDLSLYLKDIFTFINDFELDDIESVSTSSSNGPWLGAYLSESIVSYMISTTESEIKNFYNWLNNTKIEKHETLKEYWAGGGQPDSFEIILKDGTVYKEHIDAGDAYYFIDEFYYYEFDKEMPVMEKEAYLGFLPYADKDWCYKDHNVFEFINVLHFKNITEVSEDNIIYDDVKFVDNHGEMIILNDKQFKIEGKYYEIINDYSFGEYLETLK